MTSYTKSNLQNFIETLSQRELNLTCIDLSKIRGLYIDSEFKTILVRVTKNSKSFNETIKVCDFDTSEEALEYAYLWYKFLKRSGTKPGTTQIALMYHGIDITENDYRGIYLTRYVKDENSPANWTVMLRNKDGVHHSRLFKFEYGNRIEAKKALKDALEYREDIMGDIIKLNPRVSLNYKEKIVGGSKPESLIKNVRITFKDNKFKIDVIRMTGKTREFYKAVGIAYNFTELKTLVKQAVLIRNNFYKIINKIDCPTDINDISIAPVLGNLRKYYLNMKKL